MQRYLKVSDITNRFCLYAKPKDVPTKKGRETFLKKILFLDQPAVFFETAPRLIKLFDQLIDLGGESRTLIVGRELTKKFEEIKSGTPQKLKDYFIKPKGEFVLTLESVS